MNSIRLHGKRVKARVLLPLRNPHERIRDFICYEHHGALLYEGDIAVKRTTSLINYLPQGSIGLLGHVLSDRSKTWDNGVIPVDMPGDMEYLVSAAIAVWESATPLRFPRASHNDDYVSFVWSDHNSSSVGCQRGVQVVNLEEEVDLRTVVHEIGHVVGLYHEHSRADADEYIKVHTENLEPGAGAQFSQPASSEMHENYDYDSVMHYDAYAFTRNGNRTISTLNGSEIGHLDGLSEGDVRACQSLYPHLNWVV